MKCNYKKYYLSSSIGWMISTLILSIAYHEMNTVNIALSLLPFICVLIGHFVFRKKEFSSIIVLVIGMIIVNLIYLFRIREHIWIDIMSGTIIVYFIMMTIFMIKVPTSEQNSTFGIRIPITLSHKEVWNRTHQFMSIIIAGILPALFLLIFFWFEWGRFWCGFAFVILPLSVSALYAGLIGRPYEKAEAEELEKQIKKEQGYR